jgi:hypothetical protein
LPPGYRCENLAQAPHGGSQVGEESRRLAVLRVVLFREAAVRPAANQRSLSRSTWPGVSSSSGAGSGGFEPELVELALVGGAALRGGSILAPGAEVVSASADFNEGLAGRVPPIRRRLAPRARRVMVNKTWQRVPIVGT